MILILTHDNDQSSIDIIDWIQFNKFPYLRINEIDKIEICHIDFNKKQSLIKVTNSFAETRYFDVFALTAYWYRRGSYNITNYDKITQEKYTNINYFYLGEKECLQDFLNFLIHFNPKIIKIGNITFNAVNKLSHLFIAQKVGLDIPQSLLGSTSSDFENAFFDNRAITKSLNMPLFISEKEKDNVLYTTEITKKELPQNGFELTLFQELLDKKYELRIFYLNEKLYSSCIFSQNDEQTKIDFRNYNNEKPNRVIPYQLPDKISSKIIDFMNLIELNCGSLDIVVTNDERFVFLEVNPIGQFGQVSIPCHYNLEKVIAETLINEL